MVNSPGDMGSGLSLLWRSAYRYAMQRPWQTGLNMLGIMIGVMMVVAVDLANNSARRAFELSVDILNGNISHQIVGGSDGVPDSVFTRLKTELGIRRAAPAISGQVRVDNVTLTLIGLDVISEAAMGRRRPGLPNSVFGISGDLAAVIGTSDQVVLDRQLAERLSLVAGDRMEISNEFFSNSSFTATIGAVYDSGTNETAGNILLADIAGAQTMLGQAGRLDSIDLVLDEESAALIRRWLPPDLALVESQVRNDNTARMSEAFHINLLAMSLLSLLVAGLLIYNTVTLSVIQRRSVLGILRAEGVTRFQVFALVMGENCAVGLIASILGTGAGYLLGRFLVTMVTGTVDALYYDLSVTAFLVDPLVILKGILLGVILSLASALLPAVQAARSKPVTLQHSMVGAESWRLRMPWLAGAGFLVMGLGWLILQQEYDSLVTGFVALTLIVFGFCLVVPLALMLILSCLLTVGSSIMGLAGTMALRNARLAINRTGLAVAALCVAVSVTVGVGVMVSSFRGTVILWLEQSLPGDIQMVTVSGEMLTGGIAESLREEIERLPEVMAVHHSVLEQVETPFGPVRLGVNDIPAEQKFLMVAEAADSMAAFNGGKGVFVSEPLAYLERLAIGDEVTLLTTRGMQEFPILGIFHDYTSGTGLVHMHESLYVQYWQHKPFTRLTLELVEGLEPGKALASIESLLAQYDSKFTLIANRQLRELTLRIFDRTFAITNVLRLLAILVAFVGVVSTLMALQLEKNREFAILRSTGMTPLQTTGLIMQQTVVLGLCAGLLALPLGLMMSDILIDVINRRSFGWTMQHFLPERVLAEGFMLAVVAAMLAGIYPAWRAGRIRPALALREE